MKKPQLGKLLLRNVDKERIKQKIPITLTLLRMILAFIVFFSLYSNKKNIAFFIFTFTAVISFLDGFFEKRRVIKSHLKNLLDPFSDKLLVNLTAIALYLQGILPWYVAAVFVIKDALVIIGALYLLSKNIRTTFYSTIIDKAALFFQIITLMTAISIKLDTILVIISVSLTVISGIISLINSEIKLLRRKTDLDGLSFRNLIKLPDIFTLLNALAGLFSIVFAINNNFTASSIMLLVAVIFDWIDGRVAKLTRREGDFGKQLDSLSDTISFGVAPVIFGFSLIQTKLAIMSYTIFLFCGILRLARYNISEMRGVYKGMPITTNGIIIPLIYFLSLPPVYYPYVYLASAVLMVSSLSVKKLI